MSSIVTTIQEIIRQELKSVRVAELGVVEQVYPHASGSDGDNYGCDVRLKNSGLLLKRVPVATGHIGTVSIPNIGDLVLLTFDKGNINQPIIIGRMYNDEDRPPLNNPDEVIFRLPLAKPDNQSILAAIRNLEDNDPPREAILEMPPRITMRVTDGTVRATAGQTELQLDNPNQGGGTVTLFAGRTKITLNQDGDVTIEAAGSMTLRADGDLNLEGMNINIKSQVNTVINASVQATVKSNGPATLQSSSAVSVQGSVVTIKGNTMFTP